MKYEVTLTDEDREQLKMLDGTRIDVLHGITMATDNIHSCVRRLGISDDLTPERITKLTKGIERQTQILIYLYDRLYELGDSAIYVPYLKRV